MTTGLSLVTDLPAFCTVQTFSKITGLSRTRIYEQLAAGHFAAKKIGDSTLINVPVSLAYIESLPDAEFGRRKGLPPGQRRRGTVVAPTTGEATAP
jgi:hypothetical protein